MSEAVVVGVGGGGLKQYGKDDCTFTGASPAAYQNAEIHFPRGLTYADILQLSIKQVVPSQSDRAIFKYSDTRIVRTIESSEPKEINPNVTSLRLPYDLIDNPKASVTEVIIISTK